MPPAVAAPVLERDLETQLGLDQNLPGDAPQTPNRETDWWRGTPFVIVMLHNYQAVLAAALYFACSLFRLATPPGLRWLQPFVLVFPVMLIYHVLSGNKAGGYYNNFIEMYTNVWQHVDDITRRTGPEYKAEIRKEHETGVFRCVNALEYCILFFLESFIAVLTIQISEATGSNVDSWAWIFVETAFLLVLHRLVACNPFKGTQKGLFQPEALWQLMPDTCNLIPFLLHPVPSY
jgi:hypothetical protein